MGNRSLLSAGETRGREPYSAHTLTHAPRRLDETLTPEKGDSTRARARRIVADRVFCGNLWGLHVYYGHCCAAINRSIYSASSRSPWSGGAFDSVPNLLFFGARGKGDEVVRARGFFIIFVSSETTMGGPWRFGEHERVRVLRAGNDGMDVMVQVCGER